MEWLDNILPAITALIGVFGGFFGSYLLGRTEHKRTRDVLKEERLIKLMDEYAATFAYGETLFEDIVEFLIDLKGENVDKYEDEIFEEFKEIIHESESKYQIDRVVNYKLRIIFPEEVVSAIGAWENVFQQLLDYLDVLEEYESKTPIQEEEVSYLQALNKDHEELITYIQDYIATFYTQRFLPNE